MVLLARAERRDSDGVPYKVESSLLSGDGSSYMVYFWFEPA
jgi:hypothetical protein